MNLENFLGYANSIYKFGEKINRIERNNTNCDTKSSTVFKMLALAIITNSDSINYIQHVHGTKKNVRNSLFTKDEFIPKYTAMRDCIIDTDANKVKMIHEELLAQMEQNKIFKKYTYNGLRVAVIDGVESFETHKNIEGLHKRVHKDGSIGYYYKSLGISYLTDNFSLMLDLIPFNNYVVKDIKENDEKIKSEGEITVLKDNIDILSRFNIDMALLDAMFANAPCLNALKSEGIESTVRLKDERRKIYKDAKERFETTEATAKYEVVEISEKKIVNYSKATKKKSTTTTKTYTIIREITDKKLNEAVVIRDTTNELPNRTVRKIRTEKVLKRVVVWSDKFKLDEYNYNDGYVRVIKTEETIIEKGKEKTKVMYLITTDLKTDVEFIIDLMHRRWSIELNCFKQLKSRFHMDHLYVGNNNAIQLITYLMMIMFNLITLYFNVHTRKYRDSLVLKHLLEDFKEQLYTIKNLYKCFVT